MKFTLGMTAVFMALTICGCACQRTLTQAEATPEATTGTTTVTEVVAVQVLPASTVKDWLEQNSEPKAKIEVDERSNSVILHGTPDDVEQTRLLVQQMDMRC